MLLRTTFADFAQQCVKVSICDGVVRGLSRASVTVKPHWEEFFPMQTAVIAYPIAAD